MLTTPMDVLKLFPVRKSKAQKQAFRDAVQDYAQSLGYGVAVEKGSSNSHNVVIGNPDSAKYLLTAHYDTCARMFLPNLVTPTNLFVFLVYQVALVAVFVVAAIAAGVLIGSLTRDETAARLVAFAVYWALLLMIFGPANKTNANDNTSGVVTVLEVMKTLPQEQRSKVCFVLFDLEEAGLIGSASYRKAHKAATERQIIVNLDCVGDGDEIWMFPTKKMKKDMDKMRPFAEICGYFGPKSLRLHKKGFSIYPSDQANFPYGIAVGAFHRKKFVGLYYARIHTNQDTVLEQTNVNILRAALITLICK